MSGKYGIPYFANFINSDMNPEDARSMCCRLRLDKRELLKRNGGLFGAGEKTGSIGVVTLNLPRYAFEASSEEEFYDILDENMELAKESLEVKREFLYEQLERGLLPAFMEYVGTLENHFSTIGYVGGNETCKNLKGVGIKDEEGKKFFEEVLDYMRERMKDFQEETENLYNLEATPAESTCYRLAKKDIDAYGDEIFTQVGKNGEPYYTNSCHLPVSDVENITQLYNHQDELQTKHTGGTVVHNYLDNPISGEKAKKTVRYICENYAVPYVSNSPVFAVCPNHGMLDGYNERCSICGEKTENYQRVTGYIRPVSKFNNGKKAEFFDRNQLEV